MINSAIACFVPGVRDMTLARWRPKTLDRSTRCRLLKWTSSVADLESRNTALQPQTYFSAKLDQNQSWCIPTTIARVTLRSAVLFGAT